MIWNCTRRSSRRLAEGVVAVALVSGCSDPVYVAPTASATTASVATTAIADDAPPGPGPDDSGSASVDPNKPMEVLKFQFTSRVKGREPVDKLSRGRPGERVYAYITLRNRTGRERSVHVSLRVNGKSQSEVDLDVAESWSYRTWSYATISKNEKPGKLEVVITDDAHAVLVEQSLPITP